MKTTTKTTNREGGFTLLELLLVIGVAALLLIGAVATYRLVSDGNKTTETTRLLLTLRQETQTMAQQQGGTYAGITFDTATSNTASPLVASGTLTDKQRNAFNGNIVIAPTPDSNGVADGNITVEFTNLSQPSCLKLATSINNANEVVKVTINSTAITTFPVTSTAAAGACTSGVNAITWQFP